MDLDKFSDSWICHILSLLFIYVGGSCIFNSCTIHTDFSHSNWSPTSGAEINGASLLDLQVKQAMGDQALILIR